MIANLGHYQAPRERRRRPGMALLVVMVLTMLIALAAYRFSFYMESQYRLARLTEQQLQARLAALSGLEYAAFLLEQPAASRSWQTEFGAPESRLAGVPLLTATEPMTGSTATEEWQFSLISPATEGTALPATTVKTQHRFGLENESAKLSIPLLLQWERERPGSARTALLRLPAATPTLVDQWLQLQGVSVANANGNSNSNGNGNGNANPNAGRNANDRLEPGEAMRDQLRWLWYGGDLDQNFRLDPLELQLRTRLFDDSEGSEVGFQANSDLNNSLGWNRFLTWTSGQRNESSAGKRRIDLNSANLGQLHRDLLSTWPLELANFVVAFRQYGPASSPPTPAISAATAALNMARPGSYQLSSLLDLVDAHVVIGESAAEKQTLRSPFSSDLTSASNYIADLLNEASLDARPVVEFAIDVTAAPVEVLAAVPDIGIDLAQSIVQRRSAVDAARKETIAWLYTERLVDLPTLRRLQPYLIGRSDVYSLQSVGFRDPQSPVARYTAIIDARHVPARLLHRQQWHSWGRGFDLRTLAPQSSSNTPLAPRGTRL